MIEQISKSDRERFHSLLMGAVDAELTSEEQAEFDRLVAKYAEFQEEWQQYQKLKEVTQTMKFKSPPDEVWDRYWVNIYNRFERGITWILVSIGSVILLTYGLFKAVESLLADTQVVGIVKIGILLALAGAVILLISVLREKLFIKKSDPYKEVQR